MSNLIKGTLYIYHSYLQTSMKSLLLQFKIKLCTEKGKCIKHPQGNKYGDNMNIEKSNISILMGTICVANIKYNILHPLLKESVKLPRVRIALDKCTGTINLKLRAAVNCACSRLFGLVGFKVIPVGYCRRSLRP